MPLETLNATPAIQYNHPFVSLHDPKLSAQERIALRLRLCGNQWRAGLAVWRQLVQESPTLADSAPARRELLTFAVATLQKLAHAKKPIAPEELCTAITENLHREDFTDLRISLALAQAAQVLLKTDATFTPPLPTKVCEAFRAHLIKTAPQSWQDAVVKEK